MNALCFLSIQLCDRPELDRVARLGFVSEILNRKELLPDSSITLRSVEKVDDRWVIEAAGANAAACPDCDEVSSARHSSYQRRLKDLPLQGRAVRIQLGVGRWRCRNAVCRRRIFCERLPKVTAKFARETHRFSEAVHVVGYALGGRLGGRLGFPVSDDSLLRRIKKVAPSRAQSGPVPILGVDEWAWVQ
jgi:hypothetical protein